MQDFNRIISGLYFHDSTIEHIVFENAEGLLRKLEVVISYYNWEGNSEDARVWNWKRMLLKVEHCFHLRYIFPDLIQDGDEISDMVLLDKHDQIIEEYNRLKPKIYFDVLKEKEFENTISVRFNTHCYGENIFGESAGYLEICGFNASIEWQHTDLTGQIHIPAGKK